MCVFDDLIIRDSHEQVFSNAIGINPNEYMYMYSTRWFDFFKHIDTRDYKKYFNLVGGINIEFAKEEKKMFDS